MSYSAMAVRFFNMPRTAHEQISSPPSPSPKDAVPRSTTNDDSKPTISHVETVQQQQQQQEKGAAAVDNNPNSTLVPPTTLKPSTGGMTFANQESLPRLPIPDLENTCKKYLEMLQPLQTIREHEDSKSAVQEFLRCGGPELQEKLKKYATSKSSYIEQFCRFFWFFLYEWRWVADFGG